MRRAVQAQYTWFVGHVFARQRRFFPFSSPVCLLFRFPAVTIYTGRSQKTKEKITVLNPLLLSGFCPSANLRSFFRASDDARREGMSGASTRKGAPHFFLLRSRPPVMHDSVSRAVPSITSSRFFSYANPVRQPLEKRNTVAALQEATSRSSRDAGDDTILGLSGRRKCRTEGAGEAVYGYSFLYLCVCMLELACVCVGGIPSKAVKEYWQDEDPLAMYIAVTRNKKCTASRDARMRRHARQCACVEKNNNKRVRRVYH